MLSISSADLQQAQAEEKKPVVKKPSAPVVTAQEKEEANDPLASFMSLKHPEVLDKNVAEYTDMMHPEIMAKASERQYNAESHWDVPGAESHSLSLTDYWTQSFNIIYLRNL